MKYLFIFFVSFATSCGKNNKATAEKTPSLTVEDMSAAEGNSGQTNFELTVSLDVASSKAISFNYSTLEGSAKAGEDFTAVTNQTVTFQPGEKQKKIVIQVIGDDNKEGDDQFNVVISNVTNAYNIKGTGMATIMNDDTKVPFSNNGYDAPASYSGYTLIWSDEFNTNSLSSAWANQNGDGCPNLCGWGNNELEYYTDRPDNIFFQDGKLIIEAKKESFSGKNYTSSKIVSSGKKFFKYGRVDIRAKLPKGKGIWPALWMMPQSSVYGGWPKSGEIDIMELVGHEPNKVYATVHYGPGPGSINISRGYTLPSGIFNDEFHVFSMEWKQGQIKFFVDNNLYSTINKTDIGNNTWPFNEEFYFIFNLAVGGNWPGSPDATTYFPQWMIVDYVRVYQAP
jgi:beta-glucanase (GH16 family)